MYIICILNTYINIYLQACPDVKDFGMKPKCNRNSKVSLRRALRHRGNEQKWMQILKDFGGPTAPQVQRWIQWISDRNGEVLGEKAVFCEIKGLIWKTSKFEWKCKFSTFGISISSSWIDVWTFFAAQHFWPWESRHSVMEYDNVGQTAWCPPGLPSFSSIIQDPGKESNVRMHWRMALINLFSFHN